MPLCVSAVVQLTSLYWWQCPTLEGTAQADEVKGPDQQPQHRSILLLCGIRPHAEALSVAVTVVGNTDVTVQGSTHCALRNIKLHIDL